VTPHRHLCRPRRPTAAAHFWEDRPTILGGRDLAAGGTWLAVSTAPPRAALLTNFREASRKCCCRPCRRCCCPPCQFAPPALLRAAKHGTCTHSFAYCCSSADAGNHSPGYPLTWRPARRLCQQWGSARGVSEQPGWQGMAPCSAATASSFPAKLFVVKDQATSNLMSYLSLVLPLPSRAAAGLPRV
jgi:hypothetical protein